MISCDTTGVVIEKDFWNCVVEGPGKNRLKKKSEKSSLILTSKVSQCKQSKIYIYRVKNF